MSTSDGWRINLYAELFEGRKGSRMICQKQKQGFPRHWWLLGSTIGGLVKGRVIWLKQVKADCGHDAFSLNEESLKRQAIVWSSTCPKGAWLI